MEDKLVQIKIIVRTELTNEEVQETVKLVLSNMLAIETRTILKCEVS